MTCLNAPAAALRAKAESIYQAHAAAVSRGDAAKGRTLWTLFRDADAVAYQAERDELRAELEARYPVTL